MIRPTRAGEDNFLELRFEISKSGDGFNLSASSTLPYVPFSEQRVTSRFYPPLTPGQTEAALSAVPNTIDEFQRSSQRASPRESMKKLGEILFASLFEGRTAKLYQQALEAAYSSSQGLRIRLSFSEPELDALPWEFLYDASRGDFTALSVNSPVLRTREPIQTVDVVTSPLRILIASSELVPMDGDVETKGIIALKDKGAVFETNVLSQIGESAFFDRIRHEEFHVLHIIANGRAEYRPAKQGTLYGASSLQFVGNDGSTSSPSLVDVSRLRYLCSDKPDLRLICLSGDYTDQMAGELASVCPAVIGWRGVNSNRAYLSFSDGFYSSLLLGLPFETAVTQGRQRIDLDRPGGKEWAMPVCYLQAPHGAFFPNSRRTTSRSSRSEEPIALAQTTLKDSANTRLWKKLHALLEIEQHNLAAIDDHSATYPDAVPSILEEQRTATLQKISELELQIKELT